MSGSSLSVAQQFAFALHNPAPALALTGIVATAIWAIFHFRYDWKIDRVTEERDRYKRQIDESATSLRGEPSLPAPSPRLPTSSMSRLETINRVEKIRDQYAGLPQGSPSAKDLFDAVEGKTAVRANDAIKKFLGTRIIVAGSVFEVTDVLDRVSVTMLIDAQKGRTAYMVFNRDLERVRRSNRSEIMTVNGVIENVSASNLHLSDCDIA